MTGRFEPKTPVQLDPPKDDPITLDHLALCDGEHEGYPTYVAIKVRDLTGAVPKAILTIQGTVFDVSGNKAYAPGANYHVFTGKDASRALAQSSLKPEECRPEWEDLKDEHKKVLDDWFTFFSKRYNVVGKLVPASKSADAAL